MKNYTLYLVLLAFFFSCGKSTEVTIVDDSNDVLPSENPIDNRPIENRQTESFRKIAIGESGEIQTLDPLFANSGSELRVVAMIYDGLTKLDDNGTPIGAIAKKWSITRDSLTYKFTLRDNIFFHNDVRFTSGLGRQVTPDDILMNFRRMASLEVPDNAAGMFKNIIGFNAFHSEQTNIKIPGNRVITSIEGMSSDTDSTITFRLSKTDPDFLKKLAHPWASVYPRESLPQNKLPISRPIGTGEFYLAQRQDNVLILASFDNYFTELDLPTRIDLTFGKKESDIYQDFAKGSIDAIIEPSPKTLLQVTDSSGNTDPIFSEKYILTNQGVFNSIKVYYNPESENSPFKEFLSSRSPDFANFEPFLGQVKLLNPSDSSANLENNSVQFAYTENPAELYLIDKIADQFSAQGLTVTLNSSYAVTDLVSFSTRIFPDAEAVLKWDYPVFILSKKNVDGITISETPWNISFDGATVNQN